MAAGLNAGEVYTIVASHLDSASFAKANTAMREQLAASNEYQKAMDRGAAAGKRLGDANDRWIKAAKIGAKGAAIGIGTVAAALGGAAVAAASFDSSMRNVNSIAGLSEGGLKKLEKQVLNLSVAVGKSPRELADGLYSIVSSGFKAQDAMKILTAGARAARAGLTDTATATGALTAVLNAYNLGAGDARKVSDLLFQTVNVGVLNFEQLAGSLGKVLPSAKGLGVSLKDLLAAEAALTLQGNSADEATTQLGQVMASLTKPSVGLKKELHDLGFESGQAAIAHLGFKGTLDALGKAAHGNQATLAAWFSNIRAFRGVNGLEGSAGAVDKFNKSVKAMDDATKGAGETAAVFAEQQKSTAAQFDHLKAAVDVAAVTIGAALLPQINAGITALSRWLAEAQKSGELQGWARDIASDVSQIVSFLHSLGPEAAAAFHIVASTIQAAIPFVRELYHIFQEIEPQIADVAHAVAGLTSALGPAPILGAVAAYALLSRSILTAQQGVGKFAAIMKAGNGSTGIAAGNAAAFAGSIGKTGAAAEGAAGRVSTFARGLVSTIGSPTLIAAGAAGIVLSLLYIKSTMTGLKDEARDVVEALAQLEDAKVAKAAAQIAIGQQKQVVSRTQAELGPAAARVASARAAAASTPGGHPDVANPEVTNAINHQKDAILSYRGAVNQLKQDQLDAATAAGKQADATKKLGDQLTGLGQKAVSDTAAKFQPQTGRGGPSATQGIPVTDAQNAAANARAVAAFVSNLRATAAASKDLDAAGKGAANRMADIVKQLGFIPSQKQFKIIADDVAAGKSVKEIRNDLGLVNSKEFKIIAHGEAAGKSVKAINADLRKAEGKHAFQLSADDSAANAAMHATQEIKDKVVAPATIKLSVPAAPSIESSIDRINSKILHLTSNPFTVKINYAGGTPPSGPKGGHFNAKGQWVYAMGGKTDGPQVALIGEDGPEYVVPVSAKHRASGIDLWMQAGKDLGIPGYASGAKPKKPPRPKLPQFAAFPQQVYDDRASNAHTKLTNDRGDLKTMREHRQAAQKAIGQAAEKLSKAKTAKQRASAQAALTAAERHNQPIVNSLLPREATLAEKIQKDTAAYHEAARIAKAADSFAGRIKADQDSVSQATSEMQLASDNWSRAKTPADQRKYLAQYTAAAGRRSKADQTLAGLMTQVKAIVHDPNSQYFRDTVAAITQAQIDDLAATDATQAPGYQEPQAPSTDLQDYLNPWEIDAGSQIALAIARAAGTADTNDDITAATNLLNLQKEIDSRLEAGGAPIDVITQAVQAVNDAQSSLDQLSGQTTGPTADQSAQLAQSQAQTAAAQADYASSEAAFKVFKGASDLFGGSGGGGSTTVNINTVHPGDPSIQRAVGSYVANAFGAQPFISSSTGTYRG